MGEYSLDPAVLILAHHPQVGTPQDTNIDLTHAPLQLAAEPPLSDNRVSRPPLLDDRSSGPNLAGLEEVMRSVPRHRSIVAIDIERSTSPERTNPIREELRHEAYRLLEVAMRTAGITDGYCDPLADRGDGVLALIHPADEVPKTLLLNPLVPVLVTLLAERNASLGAAERYRRELRLRVVIHAGEIHYDGKGYFGEALDVAFRLLDAPRLKESLSRGPGPLVLAVSDVIYWSIVSQDYEGIPRECYQPVLRVTVGGRRRTGWVHVPGPVAMERAKTEFVPAPTPRLP